MDIANLTAAQIMVQDPATTTPDEVVAAAKLKMIRRGFGGLPVLEGTQLVGIITHRDIVLAGESAAGLRVTDLMTKDVHTVTGDARLKDVAALMAQTGYQRVPVVRDGHLAGMVTQSSIVHALAERL